jgi:phage tail-like protein
MERFSDAVKRDPYRNFNFRLKFGDTVVAACRKVSALQTSVNVTKFREGNSSTTVDEMLPGRTTYDPVTVEAGVTDNREFETWARQLMDHEPSPERLPDNEFRRTVTIDVLDIDRQSVVRSYVLHRAWVSKYTAMSDLAGDGNDVIIETLEITHEGFRRIGD